MSLTCRGFVLSIALTALTLGPAADGMLAQAPPRTLVAATDIFR
jgi:hypothetical protein